MTFVVRRILTWMRSQALSARASAIAGDGNGQSTHVVKAMAKNTRTSWRPFGHLSEPIEAHSDLPFVLHEVGTARCHLLECSSTQCTMPTSAQPDGTVDDEYALPFVMQS